MADQRGVGRYGTAKRKKRKKRPEYLRTRNENRFGMTIAALAIMILVFVVGFHSVSLRQKEQKYAARERELELLIEQEENRTSELEDFARYTKTKKYAEEVAKDKLGLAYENEVIFQEVD